MPKSSKGRRAAKELADMLAAQTPRSPDDIAAKIREHLKALASGKRYYKRADRLLDELLLEIEPGYVAELNKKGKRARLVDKCPKGRNSFPVGQSARRYEIEVTDS